MMAAQRSVRGVDLGRAAPDRLVGWLMARIYNDREVDAGALMVMLAVWFGAFHVELAEHAWWRQAFAVLPFWAWTALLSGVGLARIALSRWDHDGKWLSIVALVSAFLFAFLAFLVLIVEPRMTVTPLFVWLAYQSIKSHLRLLLHARRRLEG